MAEILTLRIIISPDLVITEKILLYRKSCNNNNNSNSTNKQYSYVSYTHSSSSLPLSWCCTHPATSQGPHVAAFSAVIGVLRLVTSTRVLLAGRDVMMAASFSLQDPLGVFFYVCQQTFTPCCFITGLQPTRYPNLLMYLAYGGNLFFVLLCMKRWFCLSLGLCF